MKLGIFDSGIGGKAVANHLKNEFPDASIVTVDDRLNMPYGVRSEQEIIELTDTAIQPLLKSNCDIIIIACNTATAVAIETLRVSYPNQKFIGFEPMIKTAAAITTNKVVAICATPATLSSVRYKNLKNKYGSELHVIEPDCSQWAYKIENNQMNRGFIRSTIHDALLQKADTIVLACTHYHWIQEEIRQVVGGATVIEPSDAIARRVSQILDPKA